jgi:GntR family transcriptional repressor for pyruvate dehydrogenase complex
VPEHISDLFEFRRFQEMQTARLAAQHITVAELRTVEHFLSMNREAAKTEDRETFLRSDDEFHRSIAIASHNVFFVEAVEQHTSIFEAIRDGKPDQAAEGARAHVESVFTAYQREVRRRLMGDEDSLS